MKIKIFSVEYYRKIVGIVGFISFELILNFKIELTIEGYLGIRSIGRSIVAF